MKRIKALLIDITIVLIGTIPGEVVYVYRLYGNLEKISFYSFMGFFILFFGLIKISEILFTKYQTIGEKFMGLIHIDKGNQLSLKRRIWRDVIILFFLLGSLLAEVYTGYLIALILLIPIGKNNYGELALMIDYLVGLNCIKEGRFNSGSFNMAS